MIARIPNCPDCNVLLETIGAGWTSYEDPRVIRCPDCTKIHAILFASGRKEDVAHYTLVPVHPLKVISITIDLDDPAKACPNCNP